MDKTDTYKVYSNTYTQVKAKGQRKKKVRLWRDGFMTGNGENGVINAGSPYDDTLIYQNINFIMPCDTIRDSVDISNRLSQARQTIVNGQSYITEDGRWYSNYCFHPGGQLRLTQKKLRCTDYVRWCDYETGEAVVKYRDKNGLWERRTFTSRADNVTVTKIGSSSEGNRINLTISFDDISKMYKNREAGQEELLKYKKLVGDGGEYIAEVAHYPSYDGSELKEAGYATLVLIIAEGGKKEKILLDDSDEKINVGREKNPAVKISDAQAVYLIAVSDRDLNMGTFEAFEKEQEYPLIKKLLSKCVEIQEKYTGGSVFSYEMALEPSAREQSALFNGVKFKLGAGDTHDLPNEKVISLQRKSKTLNYAMVERAYNTGRYAMICCSGHDSISRLYGIWTGEWAPRWNGGYTMDANVNIQSSAMNSANCISYGESYIRFVLKQIDHWKINALRCYGFKNAILAPANTDGTNALIVEYNTVYPFEYWNHGTAWMLQPIYEFYLSYGDRTIATAQGEKKLLEDILQPLLQLSVNFWVQMLTPEYYTDSKGGIHYEEGKSVLKDDEYYCIVPGNSPENMPKNLTSARAANCAADISAARKSFEMLIAVEKDLDEERYKEDIEVWKQFIQKLPPYLYDETGAIKEWAAYCFEENNKHRHISHLYCAWPSNETQFNPKLVKACLQALENRNSAGKKSEETQTHGWVHKGLVAARLKDSSQVEKCLKVLLTTKVYYNSMLTDHNTNRVSDCFCTDTSMGIVGIIDEMLMYSDKGVIEVLPALAKDLKEGSVKGLMANTQAQVSVEWNEKAVKVSVTSNKKQIINISCTGKQSYEASFENGETKTFDFTLI